MEYTIKTILYATDLGPYGLNIFNHAAGLAAKFGAKIHIIHVVEPLSEYAHSFLESYMPLETVETLRREGYERPIQEIQQRLETFCKDTLHAGADQLVDSKRVIEGFPARVIIEEAKRLNADIIVMGTHGMSALGEILIGSVAHKVLTKSTVPVLLVPIKQE